MTRTQPTRVVKDAAEAVIRNQHICSVIVPVFDHWGRVPALLESLQAQTLPQSEFEVILVDNGSTEFEPPELLPPNVRVLRCETPGSYAARNTGACHAAGAWLAFTDADCRAAPDWLAGLLGGVKNGGGDPDLVAGAVQMYAESPDPNFYEIYDILRGIPQEHYVSRGYAATANLLVPKSMLEELGGFDTTRYSGGDADLCRRARARGYSLQYLPEAAVYHPARRSWEEIVTKARRIKGGQLLCGSLRSRVYWALRTLLPPLGLYYRYASSSGQSIRYRVVGVMVQTRVWGYELVEMAHLLTSARLPPQR